MIGDGAPPAAPESTHGPYHVHFSIFAHVHRCWGHFTRNDTLESRFHPMPYPTEETNDPTLRAPYVPDPEQQYLDDTTRKTEPTRWQIAFDETSSAYTSDTEIHLIGLYTADGTPIPADALFRHERHYPDWRQRMRGACRHAVQAGTATASTSAATLKRAA